jgi:hypothetical protein
MSPKRMSLLAGAPPPIPTINPWRIDGKVRFKFVNTLAFDSHMRPQRSEVSATITPAPPFHPVLRFYGIFPDPVPFPGAAHTISGADMDDPQAVFFSKGK